MKTQVDRYKGKRCSVAHCNNVSVGYAPRCKEHNRENQKKYGSRNQLPHVVISEHKMTDAQRGAIQRIKEGLGWYEQ